VLACSSADLPFDKISTCAKGRGSKSSKILCASSDWTIDGVAQAKSLFAMIRNTYHQHPEGLLSVYSDNSAVMAGYQGERFYAAADGKYVSSSEHRAILMKVETHNHPTAIAPHPGAATGSGGEIRDEGANAPNRLPT
jgi:phosphoribosylformylglycinamidine synthase